MLGWFAGNCRPRSCPMQSASPARSQTNVTESALLESVPLVPEIALPEILAAVADVTGSSLRVQLIAAVA